ncbi:LysR family transcriptional regulator [Alienimonas californiensis]|uniref:HTH-type transcriptional regulator CynR n=1 Tax=Alienimonas californiensis TaxID=2527989 RepID=A0A517PE50_9PLAN|nr:LysR family transcriptional regulator [Alienimonas californiensis]QDT17650.1 HTH-type transcriptional regulator CynR [Alienimonas californiensis]
MLIREAEIFREVASRRSFSRAAEVLNMSQPAVSQTVGNLEKRLGVKLLDRSTRPCCLTEPGRVLLEGCRDLLDGFRELEDRVKGVAGRVSGRLCVSSIYSVGLLQAPTVEEFARLYPDVVLRLEYGHPDDVYDAVGSDEAELGLVSFPRGGGSFESIPWQREPIVLATRIGHPLAEGGSVKPSRLAGEPLVALQTRLKLRRQSDRWLKSVGVDPEISYEFDNLETVKRAVEAGAGVALVPEPTIRREVSLGTLATATLEGVDWIRPLGIVRRRRRPLSAAAKAFCDLLLETAAEPKAPDGNGEPGRAQTAHPPAARSKRMAERDAEVAVAG